jgi:hypothetical protein
VIKINDSLFLHASISTKYASTKIREINEKVQQELKGDPAKLEGGIVKDADGPLWNGRPAPWGRGASPGLSANS